MNEFSYKFLNKVSEPRELGGDFVDKMYNFYDSSSRLFNCDVNLSRDEFEKIFVVTYDVLGLKIGKEKFERVSTNYLLLLIADAKDGIKVDSRWCIDHMWYFCAGSRKFLGGSEECIPFIQDRLVKEFQVKERFNEEIKRKVFTNFMVK